MRMRVVNVKPYDFVGKDGKQIKGTKVWVVDENNNIGCLNTSKAVQAGQSVELRIFIRSNGEFGVGIA